MILKDLPKDMNNIHNRIEALIDDNTIYITVKNKDGLIEGQLALTGALANIKTATTLMDTLTTTGWNEPEY